MNSKKISRKQQEILQFIKDSILSRGFPPAVREICDGVGLKSTSSVHAHLESLEKNGYIRRDPTKPRAIEIIDDEYGLTRREMANIPIIGTVTAGEPILAVENITGYYPLPLDMLSQVPNNDLFMLKVKGESMIEAGILNGDHVIIRQQDNARNGEIVCALVDDSATIKTFYKESDHFRLQPQNSSMDPIITKDCKILGKVIGLLRMDM